MGMTEAEQGDVIAAIGEDGNKIGGQPRPVGRRGGSAVQFRRSQRTGEGRRHRWYEVSAVPMFPLQTAQLPGDTPPLRIFEPRYARLVQDCLAAGEPVFGSS